MMTLHERAYRRGALQSIIFLQRILHGQDVKDLTGMIADWRLWLEKHRDDERIELLGTYLDNALEDMDK
jgi:hypothetical protein